MHNCEEETGLEIAVIGMNGRFPGADTLDEFWDNLMNGVESITDFSPDELLKEGISEDLINDPDYVKRKPFLKNIYDFDASVFGYKDWEVENMDPQVRVFHECVYHALENAGYNSDSFKGKTGLYSGASVNMEWLKESLHTSENSDMDILELGVVAYKDFMSQLISYKLNLTGPSLTIYTACSTSLVTIHLACQGLLLGDCNIAVAGGVTILQPNRSGYLYQEGKIDSSDGRCRPFDENANGTIFGDGAGAVVLKRLDDAVEDGDHILAVIKASSCNNDGRRKVGFAAPSLEGEKEVLETVYEMAGVPPDSLQYIEAHGTGTHVGDPIEIEALKSIMHAHNDDRHTCIIGSVKANIGHLHAAAGVAGFIKTVLSINKGIIPKEINYDQLNSGISFDNTPFEVSTKPVTWAGDSIRRAGVSSFGVGGTNVHLLLEETPRHYAMQQSDKHKFEDTLLLLSAKDEGTLKKMSENLAGYLGEHKNVNLADVAFTLQMGRYHYNYRKICIAEGTEDAISSLTADGKTIITHQKYKGRPIVFMFPGQGVEYVGLIKQLYYQSPWIKAQVDYISGIVSEKMDIDMRNYLLGEPDALELEKQQVHQTYISQPLLFTVEYVMAKYLMKLGIRPKMMAGHSLGEYVAAALAGVFTLEDALEIVVVRGRLMQSTKPGSMLAVGLSEEEIGMYLSDGISVAAVNSGQLCVISGSDLVVQRIKERLDTKNIYNKKLQTSHAFHSGMMEEIQDEFRTYMCKIKLNRPSIPYYSSKSGTLIEDEEACSAEYWVQQLRSTVRFSSAVRELAEDNTLIFVELGPGNTLINHLQYSRGNQLTTIQSMPAEKDKTKQSYVLTDCLGKLWLSGVDVIWEELYEDEKRRRIPLPLYPFNRRTYLRNVDRNAVTNYKKWDTVCDQIYIPLWKQTLLPIMTKHTENAVNHWLVFCDNYEPSDQCLKILLKKGQAVIKIIKGTSFKKVDDRTWIVNPTEYSDFVRIAEVLSEKGVHIDCILHSWLAGPETAEKATVISEGYQSIIHAADAFYETKIMKENSKIFVLTSGLFESDGMETYLKKAVIGPCLTVSQEYSDILCRIIDIPSGSLHRFTNRIATELLSDQADKLITYSNGKRLVPEYEQLQHFNNLKGSPIQDGGIYIVFNSDEGSRQDMFLRKLNAKIIIHSDVDTFHEISKLLNRLNENHGKIDGIFYCMDIRKRAKKNIAGLQHVQLECDTVNGLINLKEAVKKFDVGFCMVESSISAVTGGIGFTEISAISNQLDSIVDSYGTDETGTHWISVQWDFIDDVAEESRITSIYNAIYSMLGRISRIIVAMNKPTFGSVGRLDKDIIADPQKGQPRPELETPYVAANTEAEKSICEIVEELLSVSPVGINDNFLDLGGHSLLIVRMSSRIKDVFRVELPLNAVMGNPTVKGINEYLLTQRDGNELETIVLAYNEYRKAMNQ